MIGGERDRGAVIPLLALCMTAIVMMLAIVIGLGATRSQRREARSAADAGATAGALSVRDPSGTAKQCTEAMGYTFLNVGGTQPSSSDITTACAGLTGTCSTATRTASITVDATTVTVTNPVLDTSSLMNGTELGSGISQPADATADGASCDRVGVEITRPQSDFFAGIFGSDFRMYTVHGVAKYAPGGTGLRTPALAALNQTACNAIDAGNGYIYLISTSTDAGLAISDSNGALCSSGSAILNGGSSGQICAQSAGSLVGQLHWYQAANSIGYNTSSSVYSATPATCGSSGLSGYRYVASLASTPSRTTRTPVDRVYHCTNVPTSVDALCTTADPISTLRTLSTSSSSSAPAGYTTWSSPCSTQSAALTLPSGNVWVNCPTFTVKGNALNIPGGGNVIFNGALSVEAGGFLKANTDGSADSNGYPVPTKSALQTTLIINSTAAGAFNVQSTSSNVALAQTMVYSGGGVTVSGSGVIRWTPPTSPDPSAGGLKSMMYWSESAQPLALSGSPSIFAKGVAFQGNGKLALSGSGLIDLEKVQMWVDTIGISGSGGVKLSYDPDNSVSTALSATALIR
ncbi:MAG: hypothetical protein QOC92_2293 [Acidimicrobiaceae bacterium]